MWKKIITKGIGQHIGTQGDIGKRRHFEGCKLEVLVHHLSQRETSNGIIVPVGSLQTVILTETFSFLRCRKVAD